MHDTTDQNLNIDTKVDQPHATVMKTGTDTVDPDHDHIIKDTTAKVTITPTEVIPGHTTGTTDDITRVIHDAILQYLYTPFLL